MSQTDGHLTGAQKQVAAILTRPQLHFAPKSAEQLAAEKKAAEEEAMANARVGDTMPDGTIYAGMSPDTNKRMYVAVEDAPLRMDFNKAAKYAESLEVGGKKGFRLPTQAELNVLFQNREKVDLKGTFNLTGANPPGYYWSSTIFAINNVCVQRFSDGEPFHFAKNYGASVRCVR